MKIVVTGALGHIGSRLIRDLPHAFPNAEIQLIDNLMTQRFTSLFNLPSIGRFKFIEGDVTKIDLSPHFDRADVVVHLAAMTDAAGSFGKADELEANNYRGSEKVAIACADAGARLVLISSTSVYGTQGKVVSEECTEDDLKPQSPYALSKLKEEKLVTEICKVSGLKAVLCRFGTVFGTSPGMRFHTAVNKFCWQAAIGDPITVWQTAYDQKRPYLDLFDASRAIVFIIKKDLFDGRVYNILTLNASVREIVDGIREFVPGLYVSFVDSEIMNQLSYEVSCDRFESTGFSFAGDLRRGLGETLNLLYKSRY